MDLKKIPEFIKYGLWNLRLEALSRRKVALVKLLRVVVLALRGFNNDKCTLRASALTFYSLLSLVPAVALALAIATAFGLKKVLEEQLVERLQGQEEVMNWIIGFAENMLAKTRGGIIAGIGVASLVWLVIKLLGYIEKSFNDIWGVTRSRGVVRKLADYIAIIFVCPILLVMASSVTIYIQTHVESLTRDLGSIGTVILVFLKPLSYVVVWMLFTFIYITIPNTRVRFVPAVTGGIVAGTVFTLVQAVYIAFQIGVTQYGAIYGSFAALPLFLVWLQISWFIVLFGAEMSFAHQNVDSHWQEVDAGRVKPRVKRLIALRITQLCVRCFCKGEPARSAAEIAGSVGLPVRFTNHILSELVQCRILTETCGPDGRPPGFQPARDVGDLSVYSVSQSLEALGDNDIVGEDSPEMRKIEECLESFSSIITGSDADILLRDI